MSEFEKQPIWTGAQPQGTSRPRAAKADAIRPFRFNFPEEALADLRRRIAATRLPEKETVTDFSQGVQLAFIQALARYWATDYDWRKVEAQAELLSAISSPRSTGWTSTSSTSLEA